MNILKEIRQEALSRKVFKFGFYCEWYKSCKYNYIDIKIWLFKFYFHKKNRKSQ